MILDYIDCELKNQCTLSFSSETYTMHEWQHHSLNSLILLCEMALCQTKWNEMKSVLCEMTICTLWNENLYLAKILTLWNGNLYFAKHLTIGTLWNVNQYIHEKVFLWGSFCELSVLLQSSPWHIFCCSQGGLVLRWLWPKVFVTCLENADLENSNCRPKELRPSGCLENSNPKKKTILTVFATNCFRTSCFHLVDHFTKYRFHFAKYRFHFVSLCKVPFTKYSKPCWDGHSNLHVQWMTSCRAFVVKFLTQISIKTKYARRWSNKWTKTLYQDYLHCIANFCRALLIIFSKQFISSNTKRWKRMLNFVWNT